MRLPLPTLSAAVSGFTRHVSDRCRWRSKIRLAANSESIRERAGRPRKLSGLESVRDTPEFAESRNEVARRRAVMKQRVEAMRDKLDLGADDCAIINDLLPMPIVRLSWSRPSRPAVVSE